jgi:hypothetical protein
MIIRKQFKKFDDEKQILFAEVYAPGVPDSQGDYMTADEIEKMAHAFMRNGNLKGIDRDHDQAAIHNDCVVESFIARPGDPDFIPGSWVVGIHVPDPLQWQAVKDGKYNGLSMDGDAERIEKTITLNVPERLEGITSVTRGHEHRFVVGYSDAGGISGITDEVEGHHHTISRGTVTDEADGHTHRFSYVEQISGPADDQGK